jgi:hypothetical protein
MKTTTMLTCLCLGLGAGLLPAKEGAVQCGNLIYAGTKTSRCFSDEFLSSVQQKTSIATERRFKPVKLGSEELFKFPFVIMTGEDDFNLTRKEREYLKKYLENGGFMLASPGCSNKAWSTAFQREIKRIFGKDALKDIPMDHALFNTIYTVKELKLSHGGTGKLQGITHNGKLVVAFASDGLNDTANTEGCCC